MPGKSRLESPRTVTISGVVEENPDVITMTFKDACEAKPGQFVMVWIPGIDEVPMSVSQIGEEKGITVKRIGEATKALHGLGVGDKIGVRGPYGTYFESEGKNILVVAGGIGIAPLAPFIEKAKEEGKSITLVFGAKTSKELLFLDRLRPSCKELHISTDDGSQGYHGFASDLAEEILKKETFDEIMTCGPEMMMKKVAEIAHARNIPMKASLERYMKCGVGICDSCTIDGLLVCKDGPVILGDTLAKLDDFGKQRRDACGRIEAI